MSHTYWQDGRPRRGRSTGDGGGGGGGYVQRSAALSGGEVFAFKSSPLRGGKRYKWLCRYDHRAATIEDIPDADRVALCGCWRSYFLCTGLSRWFRAKCRWVKVRTVRA